MFNNVIIGMINTIIVENQEIITSIEQSSSNEESKKLYDKANNIYLLYNQMLDKTPKLSSEANNTIFCKIWEAFTNNLKCLKNYTKTTQHIDVNNIKEKLNVETFECVFLPEQKKNEIMEANNKLLGLQQQISSTPINLELYSQIYESAFDTYESSKKYLKEFPGLSFSFEQELTKLISNLKSLKNCIKRDELPIINRSPEWYRKKALLGDSSDYEIINSNLQNLREDVLILQKSLSQNKKQDSFIKECYLFGSQNPTKVFFFENDNVLFYINVPEKQQTSENPNIVCGFTPKDEQGRYFRKGTQFDFNSQNSFTSFYTNDKGDLEDNYIEPRYWEKHEKYNSIIYFDPAEGRCACKPFAYMEGGLNPNGYVFEERLEYEKYVDSHKIDYLTSPFNVFTNYKDYGTAIDVLKTNIDFFKKNWSSFCTSRDSEHRKSL